MVSNFNWFKNTSITKKLYLAIGVMAFLIVLEFATLIFCIGTLSSVRAFVGAEGLWSKAQKDAIYHLRKYTRSGNESDFKDYQNFIKVPLGERKAREEITKSDPNREVIRLGLIDGRNHPDDVEGMIDLFLRFKNVSYISKSIQIWAEADSIIEELDATANKIHQEIISSGPNANQTEVYLSKINSINTSLTKLEDNFSFTLGEGSRWLENIILKLVLLIAFTVEISGLWLTISISNNITNHINEIIRVSKAVREGNLKVRATQYSNDEIGELAAHFNSMIAKLDDKIAALSESEAKFYSIFNASSLSISITTVDDKRIVDANQKFLDTLEYTREEVLGKTSFDLGLIVQVEKRNALLQNAQNVKNVPDFELSLRTKSGKILDTLISVSMVKIKGEDYFVSAFYDISEKKEMENALQQKTLELAASNKELEHFAHISSHDLQEPLRTVSNYMQVFEEDYLDQLDDNARKYLNSVNNATKRMSNLVKALLDYSRLGRNRSLARCDCNHLVKEVLDDLNSMISESGAQIHLDNLPKLYVYEPELRQLFQNLISNAIKFQPKGAQPTIQIKARKIEPFWEFTVKDNGIGIKEEYFPRIFDIFQRLHTADEYEGSGIGLANCKKIVQLHQGEIKVESTIGKGTSFIFTIAELQPT